MEVIMHADLTGTPRRWRSTPPAVLVKPIIPERERYVLHVGGTILWARDLAGVKEGREEAKRAPTFPSLLPGPP